MDSNTPIAELKRLVVKFRDERDWKKHHKPKDLAISISLEANELLEIFQWKNESQVDELLNDPAKVEHIREELADVVIYCLSACEAIGIDLSEAVREKIAKNGKKYPVKEKNEN